TVLGQMDATQDQADRHVLVLTADYQVSDMCLHEMDRAIAKDPTLHNDLIVVVRRDEQSIPTALEPALYADMRDDSSTTPWDLLLDACGATLGVIAPHW